MNIVGRHKFHTLDGFRGVAALFVLTSHTGAFFYPISFPHSYLAVDLFFVLSGFVLASAYDRGLVEGSLRVGSFMAIRLIRLWPLFALAAALAFAQALGHWALRLYPGWSLPRLVEAFLLSLLMLPSPFGADRDLGYLFPLNPPAWSLLLEILVNLVYATARSMLSTRVLLVSSALSATIIVACALRYDGLDIGYRWGDAVAGLPRALYSFGTGLLAFRVHERWIAPCRMRSSWWSLAAIAIVALGLGLPSLAHADKIYDIVMVLAVFPLLVLGASRVEPGTALTFVFSAIGSASYGIYILQVPVASLAMDTCVIAGVKVSSGAPVSGVLMAALLVFCAVGLDRYYDQPMRRTVRNLTGQIGLARAPDVAAIERVATHAADPPDLAGRPSASRGSDVPRL